MSDKFIRNYILTIGKALSFFQDEVRQEAVANVSESKIRGFSLKDRINYENTFTNKIFLADKFDVNSFDGVEITDLHITFHIEDGEGKNPSHISIYNLSDEAVKLLEQSGKNKATVQLRCGYITDKELPIVFLGEVDNIIESYEGPTRITKLLVRAGSTNIQNAYSVRAYKRGTTVEQIIKDLISDMKLPYGTVYLPRVGENSLAINKNFYAYGKTEDILKAICDNYNLIYSVARTAIVNVVPRKQEDDTSNTQYNPRRQVVGSDAGYAANIGNQAKSREELLKQSVDVFDNYLPERKGYKINRQVAFTVTSDDGTLIGSPTIENGTEARLEGEAGGAEHIRFKTLMNAQLQVGKLVAIDSPLVKGVYKIEKLIFIGQFEGTDWYTEAVATLDGSWKVEKSS
ncbi:baseplate hub [Rheinheimera phage Barba5S]|uniref:Tail protein n=1 Tax=Rheinheimera phage Barba5S TaxID=2849599 RepID=A0A4P8N0Y5_9CAUD|nr:baseplate hub [Rheinheimera phage Barba5S]QCQ59198.1 hypothetical protein Barba5S_gp120 [Rheinheimera phage Barba5S]